MGLDCVVYSDRVSGVVIPFPQRVRAPVVQRVQSSAAALDWRARAMRVARAVPSAVADAVVVALAVAMMAGDAWLLAAAFGVSL